MKIKLKLARLALVVAVSASSATASFAHEEYGEAATYHWLAHVAAGAGEPAKTQRVPTAALTPEEYGEAGSYHWLARVAATKGEPSARQQAPFGYAGSGAADRVVNIDGGTRYLNVVRLETVQINVGGKSVTWKFDTLGTPSFPLDNIVPGAGGVTVYVAENPATQGG